MAGKGYINHGKNIFDDMQAAIDSVHKRLDMIIGASKQPTVPTYPFTTANPGDLPDDPIQGQVAVSNDDDTLWFYSNGAWHQSGKGKPRLPFIGLYCAMGTSNWPDSGALFPEPGLLGGSVGDLSDGTPFFTTAFPNLNSRINANGGVYLPAGEWALFTSVRLDSSSSPPPLTSVLKYTPVFLNDDLTPALDNIVNLPGRWRDFTGVQEGGDRVWGGNSVDFAFVKPWAMDTQALYFRNNSDTVFNTANIALAEIITVAIQFHDLFFI